MLRLVCWKCRHAIEVPEDTDEFAWCPSLLLCTGWGVYPHLVR